MNTRLIAFALAFACFAGQTLCAEQPARTADEDHAWRLYNQYKSGQIKVKEFESAYNQAKKDIKSTAYGLQGGFAVDPEDVKKMQQAKQKWDDQLDLNSKLEAAWQKKFSGRYGDLKDTTGTIYDPTTKRTMDKMEFRLTYFRFNPFPFEGSYRGPTTGVAGSIAFTVTGTKLSGRISGTYNYTLFDKNYSDPFTGSVTGTVSEKGALSGTLSGNVGGADFTGTISGTLNAGSGGVKTASGNWTAKALVAASGTWTAACNAASK